MTIREYLEQIGRTDVTFIISHAVKDENTPFYHSEYKTAPVRHSNEWLQGDGFIDNHIVINADHPPIDVTGTWLNWYKNGHLQCAVVTTEADLLTLYSEKQARDMIAMYDWEVRKHMQITE